MPAEKKLKTCPEGHRFYKRSDCPVCPVCENMKSFPDGFLNELSAPARRALENNDITTIEKLAAFSEKEIRALHGMGPATIPILIRALDAAGCSLRKEDVASGKPRTIDEYIKNYTPDIQKKLQQLRKAIQKAAPEAEEKISYAMPTFYLKGNLVHFAAYARHIGFYPAPDGILAFSRELDAYKNSKGAVQFPSDQPLPIELISRIVQFRVAQNLEKAKRKKK